jgi:tRNA A-37 threonylcarbamoyl transferase component Bud32
LSATSSVPVSDSSSSSTATYITNFRLLTLVRVLWIMLVVFELLQIILVMPANVNQATYPPERFSEALSPTVQLAYSALINIGRAFICLGLSAILLWRGRNERKSMFFAFMFLPLIVSGFYVPANILPIQVIYAQSAYYGIAILTWLYLFPDARFVSRWTRYLYVASLLVSALPSTFENAIYSVVAFLVGFGATIYRYRVASILQRQQIKWLVVVFLTWVGLWVYGLLIFALLPGVASSPVFALIFGIMATLLPSIWPLAIGVAILRYRLWDVDLVINRSLVYGVLTILLVLLFGGVIALVSAVLPQQGQVIGVVLATVAATALFNPARKTIQNFVDRRIYRLNFDLNELAAAQRPLAIHNPGVLSGKNLNGYEVLDVVGQGGMGEVYKGFGNGQAVAIKTMLPKIAADASMRSRFQREAQAGMQMNHPHIAKVHAQGEIDGTPYLVMDYIEGQDLSQRLKADGKLDEETVTRLMQDICAALDVAHNQGFIHRDLKPSNVMIRPNGQAVLMDFGITKMTNASTSLTGTGAIGTIDYMAPEQIMSAKEVDKRADIYALGVMLYEMLTGEKPFKGSAAQILFAHLQQPVPDAQAINPEIPDTLDEAIERAMSKKPDDRFLTAGDFAAALRA